MGRAYLNVRATGWERLHPFPWKGEGPWIKKKVKKKEKGAKAPTKEEKACRQIVGVRASEPAKGPKKTAGHGGPTS